MDFWEYLLEYLKVLAWPVVVSTALIVFRKQIGDKIKSLKELETPIGTTKWDQEAQKLAVHAETAADHQVSADHATVASTTGMPTAPETDAVRDNVGPDPSPRSDQSDFGASPKISEPAAHQRVEGPPAKRRRAVRLQPWPATLEQDREFDLAKQVAMVDPAGGMNNAYRALEKIAVATARQSDLGLSHYHSLVHAVLMLTNVGLAREFVGVARDLSDLRNDVVHGNGKASAQGAQSFITAAERLAAALLNLRVELSTRSTDEYATTEEHSEN